MFETTIVHPRGGPTKCLVYPDESGELNVVYPDNVMSATHIVLVGGTTHQARMYVVVKPAKGEEFSVDPFDFRWNSGMSCLLVQSLMCVTWLQLTVPSCCESFVAD
jgi:hypothetical protein